MAYNWGHLVDAIVVMAYLFGCLIVGFYRSKQIGNIKEYALGRGSISIFTLVCAFFATHVGAGVTMGTVEKVYTMGAIFIIAQLFTPLAWFIGAMIYAPAITKFKGCLGLGHIMERLYGVSGKHVANFVNVLGGIGTIAAQIMAMGFLVEYFFHIDKLYGVILGCTVMTSYSAFGGVRAVIMTEVLQFIIFYFGIPLGCLFVLHEVQTSFDGGIVAAYNTLPSSYTSIEWSGYNISFFLGLVLFSIVSAGGASGSAFAQRFLIAGTPRKLYRSMMITGIITLPFVIFLCAIGVLIKIKAPSIDSNQAFLYFVGEYMPIGLKGVIVAGLLAIMMSTADSWMNSSSIIVSNEIVRRFYPNMSDKTELSIARITTVIFAALSAVLAMWAGSIMQLIWLVDSFWIPLLSIPVAIGFMGFRTNNLSFIIGSVGAISFTCFGASLTDWEFTPASMLVGMVGNVTGLFGAHYWQKMRGVVMPVDADEIYKKKVSIKQRIAQTAEIVKKNLIKSIAEAIPNSSLYILGIFAASYSILSYMVASFVSKISLIEKISLYLQTPCYILAFILLFREVLNNHRQTNAFFRNSYNLLLFLCLSFAPVYLMFISDYSYYYVISYIVSILIVYLLTDFSKMVVFNVVGILTGLLAHMMTPLNISSNLLGETVGKNMQIVGYTCYFLTMIAFWFERWRDRKQQEKIAYRTFYSGSLAHELRSPLATTQMISGMLNDVLNGNKLNDIDLEVMRQATKKLERTSIDGLTSIDSILNVMRDENSVPSDIAKYSISNVIMEAIDRCHLPSAVKIEVSNKNDFAFVGSANVMVHVIMNLLLNSVKHGKSTLIEIWSEPDNSLHLRDNGKGIPVEIIDQIFEDFYTTDIKNGSGIGLAFCKKVMENVGGAISFKAVKPSGAYFTLYFPKNPNIF